MCLNDGYQSDLTTQHGNAVIVDNNTNRVQPGFYILLSSTGESNTVKLFN